MHNRLIATLCKNRPEVLARAKEQLKCERGEVEKRWKVGHKYRRFQTESPYCLFGGDTGLATDGALLEKTWHGDSMCSKHKAVGHERR